MGFFDFLKISKEQEDEIINSPEYQCKAFMLMSIEMIEKEKKQSLSQQDTLKFIKELRNNIANFRGNKQWVKTQTIRWHGKEYNLEECDKYFTSCIKDIEKKYKM